MFRSLRHKNLNGLILLLIICIGIFFRFYHLGKQSIWLDEARVFFRVQKSPQELWKSQITESNPPLYDMLLCYFLKFTGGRKEFDIRLLSAIFGIVLVPISFLIGKQLFNQRIGLFFSLLIAISPNHIYYSQDAKMYTLLSLLSLLSFFFFYVSFTKNQFFHWLIYLLVTILLIYCHSYGILFFLSQIIIYLIMHDKSHSRNFSIPVNVFIAILILSIPRINCLYWQVTMDYNPWIPKFSPSDIFKTFAYFSLMFWRMEITFLTAAALTIGLPIFLFIFAFAIFGKDDKNNASNISEKTRLLALYLLLPLVISVLISLIRKPIYVAGRYDMSFFPAFPFLISLGINKIKGRALKNILVAGIIICTGVSLRNYYFIFNKSNDRAVADYVRSRPGTDTVWIFTDLSFYAFSYYSGQKPNYNIITFPMYDHGWLFRKALEADPEYVATEIKKIKEKVKLFLKGSGYIRVMYTNIEINKLLIAELKKDYEFLDRIKLSPGRSANQITDVYVFKFML